MTPLSTVPPPGSNIDPQAASLSVSQSHCDLERDWTVWRAFGLQPHRVETFKLSTDPLFVDKVRDIVGLYLNPPDRTLVLCVDEKSQLQALAAAPGSTDNLDSRRRSIPCTSASTFVCTGATPVPLAGMAQKVHWTDAYSYGLGELCDCRIAYASSVERTLLLATDRRSLTYRQPRAAGAPALNELTIPG